MIDPWPASLHRRHHGPDAEEHTGEVDVEDAMPLRELVVLDGADVEDPGVVHQHVDPAELGDGGRHRRVPVLGAGDVEVDVAGVVTEFLGDQFAFGVEDVAAHHLRAVGDHARARARRPFPGLRR